MNIIQGVICIAFAVVSGAFTTYGLYGAAVVAGLSAIILAIFYVGGNVVKILNKVRG